MLPGRPVAWFIYACVQGLPEAEPSGEVFKYKCQARSRLESILELRLEGLGKLTGSETFTYDLDIPANKQSALRNALQLVPQFGSMTDPSQPLRYVHPHLLLAMFPPHQSCGPNPMFCLCSALRCIHTGAMLLVIAALAL